MFLPGRKEFVHSLFEKLLPIIHTFSPALWYLEITGKPVHILSLSYLENTEADFAPVFFMHGPRRRALTRQTDML